ncbi:MAG: hypothetical protein K8J31_10860 [Anaerolineae bacterium]|nr:hypothetical protein [Anaerolineae bacterium]
MPTLKAEHGMADVFQFDSARPYRYLVYSYSLNHSALTLRVCEYSTTRVDLLYECMFGTVVYLDLCPTWENATLTTASREDCIALMQEIGLGSEESLQRLADETVVLYEAQPPGRKKIRILAAKSVEIRGTGPGAARE